MLHLLRAVLLVGVAGGHHGCDDSTIAAFDEQMARAWTWKAIHRLRQTFPDCDDGEMAEAYSDRVVHLLATQWKSLGSLHKLMVKDATFHSFVIRHVDATTDLTEMQAVARHAAQECASSLQELCKEIAAAAAEARKGM